MARKRSATSATGKLAGKTVAFVGKFGSGRHGFEYYLRPLVADEQGIVVDATRTVPDFLVVGRGVQGNPPAMVAKFRKKHSGVPILDEDEFYRLVFPAPEQYQEVVVTGPHGREFWYRMRRRLRRAGQILDLSGADFRDRRVEGCLDEVCLAGADFRGATITADFDEVRGAKFDNATFDEGSFREAEDCSLKNVTMNDVPWNCSEFTRCDFSGAKLVIESGGHAKATSCSFQEAELRAADLEKSEFVDCDFRGANLQDAKLEGCRFSDANLQKANFKWADLRKTRFVDCDLRKAVFRQAVLNGADLRGAQIDGADFSGAIIVGAKLKGLDLSAARNLVPRPARRPGPILRRLTETATASKEVTTSIEFALGPGESATLIVAFTNAGFACSSAGCGYTRGNHFNARSVDAPTFGKGMLNLAEMWSWGTPDVNSITIKAQRCPLRSQQLRELVTAAWHEAFALAAK